MRSKYLLLLALLVILVSENSCLYRQFPIPDFEIQDDITAPGLITLINKSENYEYIYYDMQFRGDDGGLVEYDNAPDEQEHVFTEHGYYEITITAENEGHLQSCSKYYHFE